MRELAHSGGAPTTIGAMSPSTIDKVSQLEALSLAALPQVSIPTGHVFHAGVYARTVKIPAGVMITGALIKIPTLLIVSGDCVVHVEGGPVELHGYHVLQAAAGRKQAFVALTDTHLTMVFPTAAKTVEEAEREFTDEYERLQTRQETKCPE